VREKATLALSDKKFRRITGVKRKTFDIMVEVVTEELRLKKIKGGRPNEKSPTAMVLMMLEYAREYTTYASIGLTYDLSESTVFKIIRWVEDTLIKDNRFHIPGKKALLYDENDYQIVLVDVTETSIERPKKNRDLITLARKKGIL